MGRSVKCRGCGRQVNTDNSEWKDITNRCSSAIGYKLNRGDTIGLMNYEDYKISCFKFNLAGDYVSNADWSTTDIVIEDDGYIYYPYVKKNDDSDLSNSDLQVVSDIIEITNVNKRFTTI